MATPYMDTTMRLSARQSPVPARAGGSVYLPDILFDRWLGRLPGAQMRALVFVARETVGRGRSDAALPLSAFQTRDHSRSARHAPHGGCGLRQRGAIIAALAALEERGLVVVARDRAAARGGAPYRYRLTLTDDAAIRARGDTPVPRALLDQWLPLLGEGELRVALYLCRRTYGWGKIADAVTADQFVRGIVGRDGHIVDEGCGIRRTQTVYKALGSLTQRGLVQRIRRFTAWGAPLPTAYALQFPATPDTTDSPTLSIVETGAKAGAHPGTDGPGTGQPSGDEIRPDVSSAPPPVHLPHSTSCDQRPKPGASSAPQQEVLQDNIKIINQDRRHARTRENTTNQARHESLCDTTTTIMEPLSPIPETETPLDIPCAHDLSPRIVAVLTRVGQEMNDQKPALTRRAVARLVAVPGGADEERIVAALSDAATITRARLDTIVRRDRTGHPLAMPYVLAVLEEILGELVGDTTPRPYSSPHPSNHPDSDRRLVVADNMQDTGGLGCQGDVGEMGSPGIVGVAGLDTDEGTVDDLAQGVDDDTTRWGRIARELRLDLVASNYDQWIKPTRCLEGSSLDTGASRLLVVAVPDEFTRIWLDQRLRHRIEAAARRCGLSGEIRFVVTPEAAGGTEGADDAS